MEIVNDVAALQDLLNLEKIEENIFRGQNYKTPWGRIFGGQVLAQALHAAIETVPEDRVLHSMHAYFILGGDTAVPVIYDVDRIRDGGSFTTRRVVAIQKGRPIFNMAASFQKEQFGFDHQIPMIDLTPPEDLKTDFELAETIKDSHPGMYAFFKTARPMEFRPVGGLDYLKPNNKEPKRNIWIKAKGKLGDNLRDHQEVLTYVSDYNLLTTALLPHKDEVKLHEVFLASLDHAMYFHRPFRVDEWLLYAVDSPSASNSRGFTRGSVFNKEGKLVASVIQEGLMRQMRK